MKLAVTGCPRNCAEAYVKDVGVVAIEGGRWEIYVGGAAGAHIRKGDLLCTVDDADDGQAAHRPVPAVLPGERQVAGAHLRLRAAGRHRAHPGGGRRGQRGHRRRWTPRMQESRRRLRRPVAGAATTPVTPGQFRTSLPLEVLPQVPVRPGRELLGGAVVTPTATGVAHRLGPVDQIPLGEGRAFDVDGEQVAVFRLRDGALRAVSAVCPHRGGPIADGQIDDAVVLCPLHLNAFDLDHRLLDHRAPTPLRTLRRQRRRRPDRRHLLTSTAPPRRTT